MAYRPVSEVRLPVQLRLGGLTMDKCRQCGFVIKEDRDDGFCSDGCAEVYEPVKELDERFARQEGR